MLPLAAHLSRSSTTPSIASLTQATASSLV